MWQVLLMYALFASVFTIAKTALFYSQPFFLVGSRMLVAGILMLGFSAVKGKALSLSKGAWWNILQLAFFNIYLTNVLEFWGLKYLTSFKTCFIYSLSPFLSALFSYFLFAEKMSWKKWVGLTIGIIGFAPILLNHSSQEDAVGQLFFFSWAELAVIGATVSSVYGWIVLSKLVRAHSCAPVVANGWSMALGGVFALVHSSLVERWDPVPVSSFIPFAETTLLLIIISNLICYNLYGHLLKRFSATFVSFVGFSTPFFSALFGWLYLDETIALPFYISAGVVFVGLLLFYKDELTRETATVTS